MEDKEVFTRLNIIKDLLEKGDIDMCKRIVDEQVKKLGLKLCEAKLLTPQIPVQ